ncbi:MAG: hypothetical protein A2054_04745 [Deltaproteobacteria bacterium GWA2_55_10]|nr:MAG: hypothetical protein A2054_04745 [Deltaproteobacteria bacterium GWA2_55_10]
MPHWSTIADNRQPGKRLAGLSNRMLKKFVQDFFNYGLAEVNSAKPHKLLALSGLAIMSFHPWIAFRRVFFNTLLMNL